MSATETPYGLSIAEKDRLKRFEKLLEPMIATTRFAIQEVEAEIKARPSRGRWEELGSGLEAMRWLRSELLDLSGDKLRYLGVPAATPSNSTHRTPTEES